MGVRNWNVTRLQTRPSTTVTYRACTAFTHHILRLSSALSAKCAVLIHYATVVLDGEGIRILLGAEPISVQGRSGEQVAVRLRTASGEQTVEGSDLLVAVGRIPNTTGIGLGKAGIELDARGFIQMNDR